MCDIKALITELEKNGYNYKKVKKVFEYFSKYKTSRGEIEWLKEEAEKNNTYAQNFLGDLYLIGELYTIAEKPNKNEKAKKWYKLSAELGNPIAQYQYSNICENSEERLKYLRKSAEQGYIFSQKKLTKIYLQGKEAEKNIYEALKWYEMLNINIENGIDYILEIDDIKIMLLNTLCKERKELNKEKKDYIIKIMSEHIILDLAKIVSDFCL